MASSSFSNGLEPLILGSGEAYPTNTYTQQEFLDALLKVSFGRLVINLQATCQAQSS
jgi:hypothetical protein